MRLSAAAASSPSVDSAAVVARDFTSFRPIRVEDVVLQAPHRLARSNIPEFFILDTRTSSSTSRHNQCSYFLWHHVRASGKYSIPCHDVEI
jgi:hypothetical protein